MAQQAEEYEVELAKMERSRQEWEQRQASLEESLRVAEARLARHVEEFQAERMRLEQAREQSEQQRQSLEQALSSAETRLEQQAHENQAERERLEEARRQAEQLRMSLEQALKAAEAQLARQVEEHQAERALLEQSRRELEQQRAALEDQLGRTEVEQRELIGKQAAQLAELEREHADLAEQIRAAEEQTKTLRAELQAAREREAQVLARHRSELDEYDSLVSRLQLQLRGAEERCAKSEEARRSAESGLSQIAQYQAEIARLERARQESEVQQAGAAEALRALETQISSQAAELRSRIEQVDRLDQELDQQKTARSALESALRTADTHRTQLLEESQGIRAQLEKTQQELEQQRGARLALEDACRASEAARTQLTERQHLERSQLEEAQRERDQYRVERERLRRLLAETSTRYQSLLRQRSDHFQQLLRETVARCQQDAESQLRLMTAQHLEERDTLEQLLKEVEVRQQQLDEQSMAERREFEARLAEIQAQYRRLLEYGFAAVAVTSVGGRLLNCSDAFARMFGYANGKAALAHPEEWQTRFVTDHGVVEARLKTEGKLTNAESCVRSADGRVVWVMENAMVVPSAGEEPPVVERVFLDVTERHHLKEELRRSRRTESVGKLATATVQTFNDLLTSMSGYSQLLIEGLGEGDPRRKNAERVRKVANQASSLARQLLAYARRQERPPDLLDLNLVVRRMEDLLHTLVGEDIEFTMILASDLGMVSADRAEMEQVITNFVVNARDALPLGGSVIMETSNALVDMTEAGRPPEPYVLLAVSASGYGVVPIVCPPSIDAIIARYGGHLRATNEPEKVAILRLYLPRIEPAEQPEDAAKHTGAELEEN
jgi:PAS domain S-box-containing protein